MSERYFKVTETVTTTFFVKADNYEHALDAISELDWTRVGGETMDIDVDEATDDAFNVPYYYLYDATTDEWR